MRCRLANSFAAIVARPCALTTDGQQVATNQQFFWKVNAGAIAQGGWIKGFSIRAVLSHRPGQLVGQGAVGGPSRRVGERGDPPLGGPACSRAGLAGIVCG